MKKQKASESLTYERPQAVRLGAPRTGSGECQTGSSAGGCFQVGNSAGGCTENGNSAGSCSFPGNSAGACTLGSGASSVCDETGSSVPGGGCVGPGSAV